MESEQNEVDDLLNQDMYDSVMPLGVEHMAQLAAQQLPPGDAPDVSDDQYATSFCHKTKRHGGECVAPGLPQEGTEDYAYNLRDCPQF